MRHDAATMEPPTHAEGARRPDESLAAPLEEHLQVLLTRLVEDHDGDGGLTLHLKRLDAVVRVDGWDGPTLLASVRHPETDEPEARLACSALCLLLKADADLAAFDRRAEAGAGAGDMERRFQEDAELFSSLHEEMKSAIGTAVLRGRLRAARVLARFQEGLPPLDAELEEAGRQLREERLIREMEEADRRAAAEAAEAAGPGADELVFDADEDPPEAEPESSTAPVPLVVARMGSSTRGSGRAWLAWPLLVLFAAGTFAAHLHREARAASFPAADARELRTVLELVGLQQTGILLQGTVADRWMELDYRTRAAQFERFHELARSAGFPAVVLVDRAGHPVARWSEDSVPMVYARPDPT